MELSFEKVLATDKNLIEKIATWYFQEWSIPISRTIDRLSKNPSDDVLFQYLMKVDDKIVATGGLYNKVALQERVAKYESYKPWIALLYVKPEYRNQKLGSYLLRKIEEEAKKLNFEELYLFTYTAESLYKRENWLELERLTIKDRNIVVMNKKL